MVMPRMIATLIADLRGRPPRWVVDELEAAMVVTRQDILDHQDMARRRRLRPLPARRRM